MSNTVKNVRVGNVWNVGGELHVKPNAKLVIESGAEVNGIPEATTTTCGTVKMAAKVAEAAGEAPTAAEFKALLDALKAAGIMSST